jgi:hypothetical protein
MFKKIFSLLLIMVLLLTGCFVWIRNGSSQYIEVEGNEVYVVE